MSRASLAERIWYETSVPVFLERFVLPALVTVLIGVILLNPFKFDWQQQIALAIVVVGLAYFVGHTVHLRNEASKPTAVPSITEQPVAPPTTSPTIQQSAKDSTCSNVVGGKDVQIDCSPPGSKNAKKPPQKAP